MIPVMKSEIFSAQVFGLQFVHDYATLDRK